MSYLYKTLVRQAIREEGSGDGPTFDAGLDRWLNEQGAEGWDLKAVIPLGDALGFVFQTTRAANPSAPTRKDDQGRT